MVRLFLGMLAGSNRPLDRGLKRLNIDYRAGRSLFPRALSGWLLLADLCLSREAETGQ